MNTQKLKAKRAERRRFRVRKSIYGTPQKPRLSVARSNLHISAQLIDDLNGVTLAAAMSAGRPDARSTSKPSALRPSQASPRAAAPPSATSARGMGPGAGASMAQW